MNEPGNRLNTKVLSHQYKDSNYKDKTVSRRDSHIFKIEIP